MSENNSSSSFSSSNSWKSFEVNAQRFLEKTNEHVLQGINPGGIYQAIWCRDAAYILKDWFLSGNVDGVLEQSHNEDWMDTAVRAGKIVYSQARWLLALNDLSSLLSRLGESREVEKLTRQIKQYME